MRNLLFLLVLMLVAASCQTGTVQSLESGDSSPGGKKPLKRGEIPEKYKWKTEHIYKSEPDFKKDFEAVKRETEELKAFSGRLGDRESAKKALDLYFKSLEKLHSIESFGYLNKDTDMKNPLHQERFGIVESLSTKFSAVASYLEPEFLSLPEETLKNYIEDEKFIKYKRYLRNIIRRKPYTLSSENEKIMASFSGMQYGSYEIFTTFSDSELPAPEITLSTGAKEVLTTENYARLRSLHNRDDRKLVFDAYWKNMEQYQNSLAKMLHYQIKYYTTEAKIRNFDSALAMNLHGNELPADFYGTLISNVKKTLPILHEYLDFMRSEFKLLKLESYDLYKHLVPESYDRQFSYEESVVHVEDSMRGMSPEYVTNLKEGMAPGSGWIDVYPAIGKKSGGYCSGWAYGKHPFILLNHMDTYESMTTVAHEMGHGMHSWFSNKYQEFPTARYSMFVAEIASVFNEIMLINHMINNSKNREEKIFFLNYFLEMIRSTVYRQALFAEFENAAFKKVESGGTLTPDFLTDTYHNLLGTYYGSDKGIYNAEKLYALEWSYVPHFYYNYYVYQYVVGFIGSLSFSAMISDGDIPASTYIDNFLKAGSSKAPLDILKDAGLDLTSEKPYTLMARVFRSRFEELKTLMQQQKKEAN